MLSVAFPVFVRVNTCPALVTPTTVEPKVRDVGLIDAAGAGALTPVPERVTACGEPAALSMKVIAPVRAPSAVGVKVTFTVHDAAVPSVAPHVVEPTAKFPVAVMEVMLSVAVPVFCSVMACDELVVLITWEAKLRLDGVMVAIGNVAAVPVPVRGTVWGEPDALSTNVMAPVRVPVAVGVKVTLT